MTDGGQRPDKVKELSDSIRGSAEALKEGMGAFRDAVDILFSRRREVDGSIGFQSLDCFQVLGLSPKASAEEIRNRYRLLSKIYHPDRNLGGDDTMAKVLNQAYAEAIKRVSNR